MARLVTEEAAADRQAVGEAVREVRAASGLSIRDAAQKAGRSHGWLGSIEAGERALYAHDLPRLAAALDTTPGRLADKIAGKLSALS